MMIEKVAVDVNFMNSSVERLSSYLYTYLSHSLFFNFERFKLKGVGWASVSLCSGGAKS